MPGGIPVATVAIDGAKNSALLALSIIAVSDENIREKLKAFRKKIAEESMARNEKVKLG